MTIRAEHVGSLLRPPELLAARAAHDPGLPALEERAIRDAIALQRSAGIEVVTDGEFRRDTWLAYWWESTDGLVELEELPFEIEWHELDDRLRQEELQLDPVAIGGRLSRRTPSLPEIEADFLLREAGGPFKITMASSTMCTSMWVPGVSTDAYPSPQELIADAVALQIAEVESLLDRGVTWIQLDSLRYNSLIDEDLRRAVEQVGVDTAAVLTETVAADNAVIAAARARNPAATVGVHFCRGNNRSAWAASGSYDVVAEQLFGEVDADRFLLEYDSDRAGGFEPLRFVPAGKTVVLGLVSSKTPELESADELRRRIDEAARFVPFDNLALSPQCGFASTSKGNLLTADDQRRKLELVVETAAAVWS